MMQRREPETVIQEHADIDERIYHVRLDSGLSVAVLPRPGFTKTYATYATHYGSIDNAFKVPGTNQSVTVPDGIAHFLEHKMFEKEGGGDVFDDFGRYGASSNAYTDYVSTTFLFSTTSYLHENLDILLDFVQRPYFTEENVAKEKGIIEQEIRMYLDMPGDRLHSNLMKALYHRNPVRLDVTGSVESIRTIRPEDLYVCYRTFYHPSNMHVFVTGDVDADRVIDQVAEAQARRAAQPQQPIERLYPPEPLDVRESRVEHRMQVAAPLFMMGFKDEPNHFTGQELLRREIVGALMWNGLVGRSSAFFAQLYEQGLINNRFQAHYTAGLTYGFSVLGGETPEPERLEAVLRDALGTLPISRQDLERQKRRELGEYVGLFQSIEELAYVHNHLVFRGSSLFDIPDLIRSIRIEDLEEFRARHMSPSQTAVSVIVPA